MFYEHLSGYEITHTFPGIESPILIDSAGQTSWSLAGIQDGTYDVAVRAVNVLQNVSIPTVVTITVSDRYGENIPRLPEGVPYGGTTSVGLAVNNNFFFFKKVNYSAKSPSSLASVITNTSNTSTTYQQRCSTLPVITWSESDRNAAGEFILEHAYILLDASDSTDRLKLLKYHRSLGANFWYDIGTGNGTNKYGAALTGTFSKGADTTKVIGSGTSFLSEIKDGDALKLGSTEGYRVAAVVSDTLLYVTNNFSSFTNVQGFVPNIRIDYVNDVIIARVYNTSSTLVLAETYAKVDAVVKSVTDTSDPVTAGEMNVSDLGDIATSMTGVTLTNPTITGGNISGFAPLASPAFTGTPTAPTAAAGTNNTQNCNYKLC